MPPTRTRLLVLGSGGLAIAAAAASCLLVRFPVPQVHDEFSYLLAGDTFAHGRLTNPTHPLWHRFETLHVLWQPTYMSKYPPGQGLALALGQVLGHPLIGVWLSYGAFFAALAWALSRWLPLRWAAVGSLLALLRIAFASDRLSLTFFGYWGTSYWGGAVAGLGGCLVLGSLARLRRGPHMRSALVFAAGLALLANSRPFEGLCFSLPALAILAHARRGAESRVWLRGVALPMGAVLLAAAAWMAYYDFRITGHPLRMPYVEYDAQYGVIPPFTFQRWTSPPVYRHETLRQFREDWESRYHAELHEEGFLANVAKHKLAFSGSYFLGPVLLPFLIVVPCLVRSRKARVPVLLVGAVFLGAAIETWWEPHYAAPAAGAIYLMVTNALRRVASWRRIGRKGRRALVGIVLAASIVVAARSVVWSVTFKRRHWCEDRADIQKRLEKAGGKHVVVVHYGPTHWILNEWVYNAADVDASPVVWAREMADPEERARLLTYFADRHIWWLDTDATPPLLVPLR